MENKIAKEQINIIVKDLLFLSGTTQLSEQLVSHLIVSAGAVAVKALNPTADNTVDMDLYHAVKDFAKGDYATRLIELLNKMVVLLRPHIAASRIDSSCQWAVTGELKGDLLSLTLVPGVYKEVTLRDSLMFQLDSIVDRCDLKFK